MTMDSDLNLPAKPAGALRLLHFSDLHLGELTAGWHGWLDKRLQGRLNQLLLRGPRLQRDLPGRLPEVIRRHQVDLAVCSGDITSVGDPEEFIAAAAALQPVVEACGGRFVYVPGNHDKYVADRRCAAALQACYRQLNGHELSELPRRLQLAAGVELVCIDMCLPQGCLFSNGQMAEAVWDRLQALLTPPAAGVRLLVGHYPLCGPEQRPLSWRRCFLGAERLRQWQRDGLFQALLCGHIHRPFLAPPAADAAVWQVCSGSLTLHRSFALIDIMAESRTLRVSLHAFSGG